MITPKLFIGSCSQSGLNVAKAIQNGLKHFDKVEVGKQDVESGRKWDVGE